MTTLTIEISEKVTKAKKKKQILEDLEESVKWVKLHQEGKVQPKSIEQLLSEL
jgi:hypothetical protein